MHRFLRSSVSNEISKLNNRSVGADYQPICGWYLMLDPSVIHAPETS